ncbi:MAG: hypothetical protein AB1711_10625 [Thermodesulfobacteriota bacterium]
MAIIQELAEYGIRVWLEGSELKFNPKSKLTPTVIEKIKAHKQDIAKALKEPKPDVPCGSFYLVDGQVRPVPKQDFPLLEKLPYHLLKTLPPTALYIYSRVLDDHIWLITSRELIERLSDTGKAVYLLEEIARLLEQNLTDPETLKTLHMVKTEMKSFIIPPVRK